MALTRGDLAPGFEAPGVLDGVRSTYSLEAHRGSPVVLVFYPGDNTPVCTRQLRSYTADMDQFVDLDAHILAVSPDDLDSHEDFAAAQGGFPFPLLSDTDKQIGADYGVLGPLGFYRRSVFVVDASGHVSYVHRGFAGATFRKTPELIAAVAAS